MSCFVWPTKVLPIASLSTLVLMGCVAQLTHEASQIRAMTDLDKPSCYRISSVASEPWNDLFSYRSPDADFEDAFNEALNAVASVGGNAYTVTGGSGVGYMVLEAWHCDWESVEGAVFPRSASEPNEIDATHRLSCRFITTVAEASNWGITEKRNTRNARRDALKRVQDSGGDSYFVVDSFWGSGSGTAFIIVEAWRCKPESA